MSTTNTSRRRTSKKRERMRAEILDAARALAREQGVAALKIEAIAERADVSKPSVYYYFKSKEDVLRTLALEDHAIEHSALREAIESAPPGPEVLKAFIRRFVSLYADDLEVFKIGYVWGQVVGVDYEVIERAINPSMNELFSMLEARLEEERAAGRLRPGVHCRRLAVSAFMAAVGIVSTLSIVHSTGHRVLHGADDLVTTMCDTLAFGAFVGSPD